MNLQAQEARPIGAILLALSVSVALLYGGLWLVSSLLDSWSLKPQAIRLAAAFFAFATIGLAAGALGAALSRTSKVPKVLLGLVTLASLYSLAAGWGHSGLPSALTVFAAIVSGIYLGGVVPARRWLQTKTMKYAALVRRNDLVVIHPWTRSTSGVMSVCEPYLVLRAFDPASLGAAVRKALDASLTDVPHLNPADSGAHLQPLLKAANVRSWSALVRGAHSVEIEDNGETVVFTPTVNRGARDGFVERVGRAIEAGDVTEKGLGVAALEALDLCS